MESKVKMSEQLNKEKQLLINKFEKALKKTKKIDAELVKELFPEDQNLYNKVKLLTTTLYNIKKVDQSEDNILLKNKVNSNKHNKNSTFSTFRNSVNNSKIFNSPKVSPIKNKKEKVMITNNNLNEKDILRKIEEYKNEQYKSFNQAIEEEKKKRK